MKILSLEISNIRGIRDFQHDFQGKNAIILGANGTGKSSILDAIDFLLTGNMSRLQGEGTGSISLSKHGLHVNMSEQPQEGYVRASIRLPGNGQPVSVARCISNQETLLCPDSAIRALDEAVLLARQGPHMLTRGQMLNFITVSPAKRAERIEALLNLEIIGDVRKNLVSVNSKLKQRRDAARAVLEASQGSVASILGLERYESTEVLRAVNDCRQTLGAGMLECVAAETIIGRITLPAPDERLLVSTKLLTEHATNLLQRTSEPNVLNSVELERDLREKVEEFRSDPVLFRSLSQQQLLELGISLAVEDSCPLCDLPWIKLDLIAHLEKKIAQASTASRFLNAIRALESDLRAQVNDLFSNLERILFARDLIAEAQQDELMRWKVQLEALRTALQDSLTNYPVDDLPPDKVVEVLFAEPV